MTPAKYLAEAEAELERQYDKYEAVDTELAGKFLDAVDESYQYIRSFPAIGPPLARGFRKRVLRKPFGYQMIYTQHDGVILIVAIWADRRDPKHLMQRLNRVAGELKR